MSGVSYLEKRMETLGCHGKQEDNFRIYQMKKTGKIILYTFSAFLLLIVVLVIIAALAQNKIAKIAVEQVSKTTNIPIQVDDIDFSLVHNFPRATIQGKNIRVSSPGNGGSGESDTLAYIGQLYLSVDIRPLMKGILNIRKVEIVDGKLFYQVDSVGVSNLDFLNDTTKQDVIDTSANAIFLDIKDFTIENTTCNFRDKKQKAAANLLIDKLKLSGLINDVQYKGEIEGKGKLSNCAFDTTTIYLMKQATLDFKLNYDEGLLTINRTNIAIDEDANLMLNGLVKIGDSLSTDITVNAEKLDLEGLSKYVPDNYFKDYGISDLSGILAAEAHISGMVTDSIMPFVDVTFNLSDGNLQYQDYPALNHISLVGKATNGTQKNNATTSVDINALSFQTGASKFTLSGKVENPDKLTYNLSSTMDLDLKDIETFVPDTLVQSLSGRINAVISTKGTLPDSISDEFIQSALANTQANLQLENVNASIDSSLSGTMVNADIEYQPNQVFINRLKFGIQYDGIEVDSLRLKALVTGNFTPDSFEIQFNPIEATLENSKIELTGKLKNLSAPDYSVGGTLYLDLNEIGKLVPDSLVNSLSGNVSASFASAAKLNLDSISSQINNLLFEHSNFSAECNGVSINMPDSMMSVSNLSGKLWYNSDTLQIPQLNATYLGMQLGMNSVTAASVYSAAIQNQPKELDVHGNFNVDHLDYALVEKFMEEDSMAVPETDSEPMKFTYKINGRVKANSLKYEDALFTNVDSKFLVEDSHYVLDSLNMDAFDGSSLSSIKIEMKDDDEMDMYFKTDINKMDVAQLIKNFGQYIDYEDIKAENVQGLASTKMDGKIVLKNFEPVYESLLLNGDLTIENGALINVKPVMEVEKIPGIGLKNMDKLYFSTLNSSLFLFNNKLYIPRTEIRSTSFDAMFLGMYSFDEDYEYHIRMYLGEVLSSKSKANLKKQAQDGGFSDEDEKDLTKGRTSIYVVSKSVSGKEKAGFDNKRDRANMEAKVNLQKQMVDMRFHPTLVNYNTEE